MKIFECCPFFKENLIAGIHIAESSKWVDEIHISESDYTLQYKKKEFYFDAANFPKVHYHKHSVENIFLKTRKYIPHIRLFNKPLWHKNIFRNTSWFNEGIQRKLMLPDFKGDDILILSDIDEIIDAKHSDRIIEEVKKRGIVTVKLHFTLFYFNLFSSNWSGPVDYSYRTFIIKGDKFRKDWHCDYDTLRKAGEGSKLLNEVFCIPEIMGFHHSWLGDENYIKEKLEAYTHPEHQIYNNKEYIKDCLVSGKSLFPGHELKVNNHISMLDSVKINSNIWKNLFFDL